MRERWLGATGIRVPEIAVEGELELPVDVLWLEDVEHRRAACGARGRAAGRCPCGHARKESRLRSRHPEVACVLVPPERRELLDLDLTALTYG